MELLMSVSCLVNLLSILLGAAIVIIRHVQPKNLAIPLLVNEVHSYATACKSST